MKNLRYLIIFYLVIIVVITFMPTPGMNRALNDITVLSFRADYLLHTLFFLPLVPLWKLCFKEHSLWVIIPASVLVAVFSEASHYVIPYRSYNINDLIANVLGVLIGAVLLFIPFIRNLLAGKV